MSSPPAPGGSSLPFKTPRLSTALYFQIFFSFLGKYPPKPRAQYTHQAEKLIVASTHSFFPHYSSWRDRIRFTLLFGIATSVELFQARLLKSTAQLIHGSQFDVVQANTVLENVFKVAIASKDVALRLGPGLLHTLVERQREQVAGIQILISSVKVRTIPPP